jgi:hypothetical protein
MNADHETTRRWLPSSVCRSFADDRLRVDICDGPNTEITRYLAIHRGVGDSAFTTLSYFDGVNFATRVSAPALFSVGLMDWVCPPRQRMPRIRRMAAQRTWSFSRSMTTRVDSATNALPQINRLNDLIGFQNAG